MEDLPHSFSGKSQATEFQPQLHGSPRPPALRKKRRLPRRILRWSSQYCSPSDLRRHLRAHGPCSRSSRHSTPGQRQLNLETISLRTTAHRENHYQSSGKQHAAGKLGKSSPHAQITSTSSCNRVAAGPNVIRARFQSFKVARFQSFRDVKLQGSKASKLEIAGENSSLPLPGNRREPHIDPKAEL